MTKKKQHTNYKTHSHCLVQIVWRLSQIFHAFFQHSTTNWNWEKGNVIIYMKNLNAFNKWASIYWLNIHNQINAFLSIMILTVSFTSIFGHSSLLCMRKMSRPKLASINWCSIDSRCFIKSHNSSRWSIWMETKFTI